MKVACQMCDRIVNDKCDLKGNTGYYFEIQVETEPYINAAVPRNRTGYLCHNCSKKIGRMMKIID